VNRMEMETQFRLKVDSLLMTASWVDRLRHELGLLGASQVWGERPAWYLWLADSPGAYHLEMMETSEDDVEGKGLARALFSIKFYPSPDGGLFNFFSPRERALALNGCFDHTGTPLFEKLGEIPPHLFTVGSYEMVCQPGQDWMIFCLAALDLCREVTVSPTGPDQTAAEVVVRRAPGWELTHGLFSRLLSLWSFQHKQTPSRIQMTTESGFETIGSITETPDIREAPDISLQNMWVMFGADMLIQPPAALRFLDAELVEPGRQELINQHFSCGHFHLHENQIEQAGLMSRNWWHLASADYKSERCTSCGCDH
jgi:hypothetical protein